MMTINQNAVRPELILTPFDFLEAEMPSDSDIEKAAFGIYPRQRSTSSSEETKRAAGVTLPELVRDYLLPQDAVAVGLGLAMGPGGKLARKAGAALIAGGAADEAQAGGLSALAKLRALLAREAPEQAATIREALRQSARTGNEASVVGTANIPRKSSITIGIPDTVVPNASDRAAALDYAKPGQGIIDFHTHPVGSDDARFLVRPSSTDLNYYNTNYKPGDFNDRELRTLIVQPPSLPERMPAAYSMFATDKPAVLAPRLLDTARNELGMAARKGRFKSIMDDPTFRDYFDYGGELSDLIADAAPMLMLRHRAAQGVGRHEYELSGRTLTPNPESTEANLLKRMEPTALEIFRERKYALGGLVQKYADGGLVGGDPGGSNIYNSDAMQDPASAYRFADGGQAGDVRAYADGGLVANSHTADFDPARIDAIVGELHAMNAG